MFNELLWVFTQLPDNYIVVDTETTGLPDKNGLPDIVTLGIAVVRNREIVGSTEFKVRPKRQISAEAQSIHGISNMEAGKFEPLASQWHHIADYLNDQLIIIHNASFDWPILLDHIDRYQLPLPSIQGVFCSQKAATAWAQAMNVPCGPRGPSLDTLTQVLSVEDLRRKRGGVHGAVIDSQQSAQVVEALRRYGAM